MDEGTYKADSDFQEIFYNFLLHPSSHVFAGVNITHIPTNKAWEAERLQGWEKILLQLLRPN
jgi:hypothetical protein